MAIEPVAELGCKIPDGLTRLDLKDRIEAMFNTVVMLEEHGMDISSSSADPDSVKEAVESYADDPKKVPSKVNRKVEKFTPASIVMAKGILDEFSHAVVENAVQIRRMVTNKLLIESENPDPRIRLKSLELLGKISDVGLFAEKSEVTVTHQSSEDLRAKLKAKLNRFVEEDIEDAVVISADALVEEL